MKEIGEGYVRSFEKKHEVHILHGNEELYEKAYLTSELDYLSEYSMNTSSWD